MVGGTVGPTAWCVFFYCHLKCMVDTYIETYSVILLLRCRSINRQCVDEGLGGFQIAKYFL